MTTRRVPTCPHAEQAVGLALHALEPAEEVALVEHLPHCEACRVLVDETNGSLALLGGSSPAVDPPPRLKAELMARIAETPQSRTLPADHTDHERTPSGPETTEPGRHDAPAPDPLVGPAADHPAGPSEPSTEQQGTDRPTAKPDAGRPDVPDEPPTRPMPEPEPPTAPVTPTPRRAPTSGPPAHTGRGTGPPKPPPAGQRSARRFGRKRLALVAAALVAVLGIGGLVVRNVQLEQQRDAETAQAAQLARVLDAANQPGTQHAILATTDGQTMAAVLVQDGRRELITVALPANPSDHTYVLWGIDNGSPRAISAFDVTPSDPGVRNVTTPSDAEQFTGYAISLEPGKTPPPSPSTVMASGVVSS